MKTFPVESSNVRSVGYDPATRVLEVTFGSGDIYHYVDVSPQHVCGLLFGESVGSYLAKNIKPNHAVVKMTGAAPAPAEVPQS